MSFDQLPLPMDPPPASPVHTPSFAEARMLIRTWIDLPETRRRDMTSALAGGAKVIGQPEAAIPCDVAWLNRHLFARRPAVVGTARRRFANIVSLIRAVLRRLALHAPPRRGDADLPEAWRILLAGLTNGPALACLRGFARYCTGRSLGPWQVDDAVLADFAAEDGRSRLSASSANSARTVTAAWNSAVRAGLPGWPATMLTAPRRRETYVLPLEAFPESFREDFERYRQRISGTDQTGRRRGRFMVRGGDGPRVRLRPRTVATRLFCTRQAASILVHEGVPIEEIRALRDLVDPSERPGIILDWLAERHAAKNGLGDEAEIRGGQVAQVAETLRQIAMHHVGLTGPALDAVREFASATRRRQGDGMSPKVQARLRRLIQRRPRALLLHLPDELMAEARAEPGPVKAARLALWAAALETLMFCPLRADSLLQLRLDRNLARIDPRTGRLSRLVLFPENTKNKEPLDWPVPPRSAALIDEFLRKFRPALAGADNPFVFPSADGAGARSYTGLSQQLTKLIADYCEVEAHLHLVRHLAAWRYLKEHPGRYEDVRRILGHRDVRTTQGSYIAFETEAAAVRFDGVILREKYATRAIAAAAWATRRKARRGGTPGGAA
jgi:integrase